MDDSDAFCIRDCFNYPSPEDMECPQGFSYVECGRFMQTRKWRFHIELLNSVLNGRISVNRPLSVLLLLFTGTKSRAFFFNFHFAAMYREVTFKDAYCIPISVCAFLSRQVYHSEVWKGGHIRVIHTAILCFMHCFV
jgi:hypothetical protein